MADDVWIVALVLASTFSMIVTTFAIAQQFSHRRERRPTFLIPTSLPVAPPFLAGREQELQLLAEHIRQGAHSILIKGKPGTGKSALALAIAHQVAPRFTDGQLFTALNPVDQDRSSILLQRSTHAA